MTQLKESKLKKHAKKGNRRIDLAGKRFGKLFVTEFAGYKQTPKSRSYYWLCKCDCGNVVLIDGCCLRRGSAKHCGCEKNAHSIKHGKSETAEYQAWLSMRRRCLNKNSPDYQYYGGRGIKICCEWLESFGSFLEHVGDRPTENHSIDRIDVNGDYEPGNVRWATRATQAENSRQTRWICFRGVTNRPAGFFL